MQMRRWNYYSVNRAVRAAELRHDGYQAAKRGFPTIAEVCLTEAALLAPPMSNESPQPHGGVERDQNRTKQGLTPSHGLSTGYSGSAVPLHPAGFARTMGFNASGKANAVSKRFATPGTNVPTRSGGGGRRVYVAGGARVG